MKNKKQFIIDALLPYKLDKSLCAVDKLGSCSYRNEDNKKCAIGQFMKIGFWQRDEGSIDLVLKSLEEHRVSKEDAFLPEFLEQDLPIQVLKNMQMYHDRIARDRSVYSINHAIQKIECELDIDLSELKFEEVQDDK